MKKQHYILLLIFFQSLAGFANQPKDSVIFRAMGDELARSMTMEAKGYSSPSFISYTYMLQNSIRIFSQQGALMASESKTYADESWRLTIGDYNLNDENFQNRKSNGPSPDLLYEVTRPPIYPDYKGLRNSLWAMTNYSYKVAAPNQKSKQEIIEKYSLADKEELLPDFSSEEPITFFKDRQKYTIDQSFLEEKSRMYSAFASALPEVEFAGSSINIVQNDIYYLNTEGSQFKIPMDLTQLTIKIKGDLDEDSSNERALSIIANTPQDLPADEEVKNEVLKLAANITAYEEGAKLEEDYSGPVMVEGNVVGEVFLSSLFTSNFSLRAWRNDLVFEDYNKVYFEEISNKLQFKIGEKVMGDAFDIIAYPRLKYNGKDLIGGVFVDSEAVVPSDSLILVKDGVLKNLISDRVPTNVTKTSSGYRQFTFNGNGISVRRAPSVLKIDFKKGQDAKQLKQKLLDMAKDKGYKYAYIIRSIPSEIATMPAFCYRVDVNTGEEEIVKEAYFNYTVDDVDLGKLNLVSDQKMVYSFLWGTQRFALNRINESEKGLPLSLIFPSAILLESADIKTRSKNKNIDIVTDEISNPLKR